MNKTLVALWILLATAIIGIAVFAVLWTAQRQQDARRRAVSVLQEKLQPYNRDVARVLAEYEVQFQRLLSQVDLSDANSISSLKQSPLVDNIVVIDHENKIVHPPQQSIPTQAQSLIADAYQLLVDRSFLPASLEQSASQAGPRNVGSVPARGARGTANYFQSSKLAINSTSSGWTTWYHQRGIVLGYWWQQASLGTGMIVVPRSRWIADIIAELPNQGDQSADQSFSLGRCELVDIEGTVIYQWGHADGSNRDSHTPDAEQVVVEPLDAWRWRLFASENSQKGAAYDHSPISIAIGVGGLSLALVLLGVLATLNLQRAMRLASQRVSFVNHVSHELRTPLTNIRMYADLLYDQLQRESGVEEDPQNTSSLLGKLNVVRQESDRLGRLISNVLLFAQVGKKAPLAQTVDVDVDEVIDEVLQTFEPQLAAGGFQVERTRGMTSPIRSDRSALKQIMVNLIGNAEKYAAHGKFLSIVTRQFDRQVEIYVADHGPGIPAEMREKIFLPFFRVSDSLKDPAGTGIGLTISRRLARELGGDCELKPSDRGACFCVRMNR